MLEWRKYTSLEELRKIYGDKLEEWLYKGLIQKSEELETLKIETKSKIELIVDEFTTKLNSILEKVDK